MTPGPRQMDVHHFIQTMTFEKKKCTVELSQYMDLDKLCEYLVHFVQGLMILD